MLGGEGGEERELIIAAVGAAVMDVPLCRRLASTHSRGRASPAYSCLSYAHNNSLSITLTSFIFFSGWCGRIESAFPLNNKLTNPLLYQRSEAKTIKIRLDTTTPFLLNVNLICKVIYGYIIEVMKFTK